MSVVAYTGTRKGDWTQVARVLLPDHGPLAFEPIDYAGFDWGNRDSVGSHALAYALLLAEAGAEIAHQLHDDFLEVVANLAHERWSLSAAWVGDWLQERSALRREVAAL